MHLIERSGALAELDELNRQWRSGALTNEEYQLAFRQIDAAHSHTILCANNDHRIAQQIIGGKPLCAVCGLKAREARA